MNQKGRFREILATYYKHGWQLQRVLMLPETRAEMARKEETTLEGARMEEASIDALWFSRRSPAGREAWELRLLAETPYALFVTFEADEREEAREEVRHEMEARMRESAQR